jgi:hypothetical protein
MHGGELRIGYGMMLQLVDTALDDIVKIVGEHAAQTKLSWSRMLVSAPTVTMQCSRSTA